MHCKLDKSICQMNEKIVMQFSAELLIRLFCVKFSDSQSYCWDSLTGEVRTGYVMIMETLMLIIITCAFFFF